MVGRKDVRQYIKFVKDTIFWHNMVTSNDEAELAFRKLYERSYTNELNQIYVHFMNY